MNFVHRVIVCLVVFMLGCKTQSAFDGVEFKSFSYEGHDPHADAVKPGENLNPILAGFFPDPSICRVGEDYYLINSTFAWFPGVPIHHSRDLVNWELIGHVLDRPSQLPLKDAGVSGGIFAPSIHHHDGVFYMITTNVSGMGNFLVTARDPKGPWSEPIKLPEVQGIDPSLFFDDDGKTYVVHNGIPDGTPLYSSHRTIRLIEVDLSTGQALGASRVIVNGGTDLSKQPVWIEGPHLFKRNGWYYLIAAEGGTGGNHSEVVFRTRSLNEPFVPFESNPILTQRHLPKDRPEPVTCTGHADLVETQNGQWWAVFLAQRPYEGMTTNLGRETFMLPVTWENDWPVILKGDAVVPRAVARPDLPQARKPSVPHNGSFAWRDEFDSHPLSPTWNFLRAVTEPWYSLSGGSLFIQPRPVDLNSMENPSLIARRQQHAEFRAETVMRINNATPDCDAGIVAFYNQSHHYFLGGKIHAGQAQEIFLEQRASKEAKDPATVLKRASLGDKSAKKGSLPILAAESFREIELAIHGRKGEYTFLYRLSGQDWIVLQTADGKILSNQAASGFVGTYLGMFARINQEK